MKKIIKLLYQKTVALIVTVSFLVTILIPANSFAFTNINSAVSLFIPAALGKVTSSKFYDSQEFVINIQDLHCHPQTQRNISAILEYLNSKYNIDKIYLEGAYKNINTKLLSGFKNEQFGNKILESLVDTGKLSGTEYYSAISGKNEIIAPMEDENLYKENIKLFNEIINKRPEIEQICFKLEKNINSIKKEYFEYNRELRKFEKIITKFKNKKLTPAAYYGLLKNIALNNNINLKKYPNITAYINLLKIHNGINKNKLSDELKQFLAQLKTDISYQEYIKLLNESNNFKDITNISQKLLLFNETYKITEKLKLKNVNNFLQYVEFNKNINPIEFIDEEENLIDDIFSKSAKNKYEHEVIFLSYFLPKIKDYFLADITAKNYYNFDGLFFKFKKVLLSYSSDEIVSQFDKYQNLLSLYHKNNIKRDSVFAQKLIKEKNNSNVSVQNTQDALKYIENNLQNKKIKLVVTGGFHTAGLEKTLENNRISYIIITPKVTSDIDKAKEIYTDTIKYNANILTNTINVEPLCQNIENLIAQTVNDIFYHIKNNDTFNELKKEDILSFLKDKFADVEITDINYSSTEDEQIKYTVTYSENGKLKTIENTYSVKKENGKNIKKSSFTEAVIFKDLFKSFGEKINLIYKTIIAPIAENFVFLYVPFITTVTVAPYLVAVPFAVTAIFGVFVFPLAHIIVDTLQNKEQRSFKQLLIPSSLFAGVFLAIEIAFPGSSFIAFIASSAVHSIYNVLVLKRKINLPLASIFSKFFGKSNTTIEDIDNIIEQETMSRYYKIDLLKQKLIEEYPSNKKVGLYIIKQLYNMRALNNIKIIPDNSYYNQLYSLTENLKKLKSESNNINRSDLKILNKCIKEFDYLLELAKKDEININEDIFPILKMLLNDIIDISYELTKEQKDKEVELLLNSTLPLYNEIVTFYKKTDDNSIETVKNIASNFIKQNNFEAFYAAFKFITIICKTNKNLMYEKDKNVKLSVMELFLDLVDNSNDNNFSFNFLIERLKNDGVILSNDDIKNIIKYYKFSSQKENTAFYNFIFDKVISNCDDFDIEEIYIYIHNSYGKNSIAALNLFLEKLYNFVIDKKNDLAKRKVASVYLGEIISFAYEKNEINTTNIDINKVNNLYNEIGINARIFKHSIYLDGLFAERDGSNFNNMFSFTPLFENIHDSNILNQNRIKSKIVFYHISGENIKEDAGNKEIIKQFNAWKELVSYNDISLEQLSKLYFDVKKGNMDKQTIKEKFYMICDDVDKMITAFKEIDIEKTYVYMLKKALDNIKDNFHPIHLDEHVNTLGWEANRNNLSEIKSLNTLINAVHQLSAIQFRQNINKINTENKTVQKWYLQNDETKIVVNNLSDKVINNEIWELVLELFKGTNASFEEILVYNDELYCTCKLNTHSVGIYFNFSPNNKSISISFTESVMNVGNKERIKYFKKVLKSFGFDTSKNIAPFTLQVSMDENTGINNNTDFVKLTKKILLLFRYSSALDLFLRDITYDNRDMEYVLDKFKEAFLNGFIWFNYMDDGSYYELKEKAPVNLYLNIEDKQRFKNINSILENLNLKPIPQEIIDKGIITQEDIDEYINIQLERAFADGRIFIDKNGFLSANSKINLTQEFKDFVKNNADVSIKQAELLSLIDNNKFNFKFVDMIGGLVLKSGYIKLANGNFLSVNVLMEPNGREFKFAKVEEVEAGSGKIRKFLNEDYDTLRNILIGNYYKVPERIELISDMEKINRTKLLDKKFVYYDTSSIFADGVSAGKGNYVPVKISYDKNKTDKKTVWVTPYTTVEDEKEIRNSGAIITTTGGKVSHASIVTNEFGVPAVNIPNGIWEGGKLYAETLVDDKIELKELKEGSTLLVNGETGQILIFDSIDESLLDTLLYYINIKDINGLVSFFNKNGNNKDLNKLVECAFFQLQNNEITEILHSDINNDVKKKLQNLTDIKLKEIEQQIEQTIINIKSTDNGVAKHMLVKELDKKIKNINNINDGLIDRYTVYRTQVLEKINKFTLGQLGIVNEMMDLLDTATDAQKVEFLMELRKIEALIPYLETNTENKKLEELRNKTATLKENILSSVEQTNTTNIKSSDNKLTLEDFVKYGAKFLNTAITSKILKGNKEQFKRENIKVEVPSAYSIGEDFLTESLGDKSEEYIKLNNELDKAIQDKDYVKAKNISRDVIKLIRENSNKNKLNKILEQIDDKTIYVVRSSGLGEDEGKSFAGMGKTNLNVTKENIVDSIVDSWQAFYLETPISYMINNRKRVKPCIMVQPFIAGEKSGVAFSENKEGNSIISVGYGLGEGIVNNIVPTDTIAANISNGEIIEYVNVNKKTQILPKENENGTEMKFVEDEIKAQSRALSNDEVKALMKVIKILEKEYGYPIDVEWTIKDGIIYILQVRPITILNTNEDDNIQKQDDKNKDKSYVKASIFDNLFSNKTTNLYKYWTTVFAPIIESLFIVIPFIFIGTNPLILGAVSVVGFAVSHRFADEIINKFIDSSAKVRSLSDITKIAGAGVIFSTVFLATNILLPGYPIVSFIIASVAHSIYNYISTKTDKLPAASLINEKNLEEPIADEANFDVEEISENDVSIEQFIKDRNKNLENAIKQTISNLDKAETSNAFYGEVLKIKKILQADLLDKETNETTILIVDSLFMDYTKKINSLLEKKKITIEQASVLFNAIIPLYQEMLNQNINFDKTFFADFKKFVMKYCSDGKVEVYDIVALLIELLDKTDTLIDDNNRYIVEIAKKMKKQEDTNAVLEQLKDISPKYYVLLINYIFKDIGLNENTLNYMFESLQKIEEKDYKLEFTLNPDDKNIEAFKEYKYTESKSDKSFVDYFMTKIIEYSSNLDMGYICHYIHFQFEGGNGNSEFTKGLIKELTNLIKDKNSNLQTKKQAAVALGKVYSIMYEYVDFEDIVISIDDLNKFYKENNMNCKLIKNGFYIHGFSGSGKDHPSNFTYSTDFSGSDDKISKTRLIEPDISGIEFMYTPLLEKNNLNLPEKYKLKEHAPSFIINSYSNEKNKENKIAVKFDALNKLLEYNSLAVSEIYDIVSSNNSDKKNNFKVVIDYLEKMIDFMEIINKEHADKSRISLERIKKDIYEQGYIDRQIKLKTNWNEGCLDEIDTLHTLVNAVHQTSFEDIKYIVKQKQNLNGESLLEAKYKGTEIKVNNFSNNQKINTEVINLIHLLSLDKHNVELFVKDGTVIWTKRLLEHSVDIISKFDEPDRGIKIYYNEGGSTLSNKWRIEYYIKVLETLGFSIDTNFTATSGNSGVYNLNANLDNNSGLDDKANLAQKLVTAIKIFEYSVNMDTHFEEIYQEGDIYGYIEGYAELFNNGEIPSNYTKTVYGLIGKPHPNEDIPSTNEIKIISSCLNDILKNLGLSEFINEDKFIIGNKKGKHKILDGKQYYLINFDETKPANIKGWGPEFGEPGRNFFQKDIDKYFNEVIEEAFIKGQIILKDDKLIKNKNYNVTETFVKMLEDNSDDVLRYSAEIIEDVPEYAKTYYDTEISFNNLIARTGSIKLDNGYIYIQELFNPIKRNIEYAQAELVTLSQRKILSGEELEQILKDANFEIKNVKINSTKKTNTIGTDKTIAKTPEQLINAKITSIGENKKFVAEAVFDNSSLDNVYGNKILFKEFTTPKDFSAIKKATGIITTSGGSLSHAAITTKELGKPSLILQNADWKTDENGKYLEVAYYKPYGETETKTIKGENVKIQKMQKEIVEIRQGDKIFMSSENGFIVKLSDDRSQEQLKKIDEYLNVLNTQRKEIQKKQWLEELNIIVQTASKAVAEILLFDVRYQIENTTLLFTGEEKKELENEMKETKNMIYENIEEQYSEDYYQEQNDEEDIDKFIKEKDIVSLDNINANQKNRFGGKTVELAKVKTELKDYDVIIPNGLGLSKNVPTEYYGERYKKLNEELNALIIKNKKDIQNNNEEEIEKNKKEIDKITMEMRNIIENNSNKEIEKLILKNIDENKYYAVRSSGIGEDGRKYAFAGMGESVLNVKGSDIIREIKTVWKSFYDKDAIEYMLNTGQFIQPAVLIQEMSDAAYAGVVNSRNEKGYLIINATEGLGDKVVDGTVTPDEIEVDPITGEKTDPDAKTILTPEQIKLLTETVMFLEDKAGYPVDIEFAFDKNGKLNILQRRPDTKFSKNLKPVKAEIDFVKTTNNQTKLFCIEHNNKEVPVTVEFDKKNKQITFVVNDDNFNIEDKNTIINKIKDRINTDIVVRAKVNRQLPIFNAIAPGQLKILPPVPVDNLEIDENDIDDFKNSRNTLNILTAA